MNDKRKDEKLLERFFATFARFDDLTLDVPDDPAAALLDCHVDDSQWARCHWRPTVIATDRSALVALHHRLPHPLPALYEKAICSYRWLAADLGDSLRLFANPPGPDFTGLLERITADTILAEVLLPQGYVPLGLAGDSYDQICFATRRSTADDCAIVRIEHESVLCDGRIGHQWDVAPSFRHLVQTVIEQADELS